MTVPRSLALVFVLLLGVCLLGCSSAQVASTYDSSVDFSKYHSFAFRADRKLDMPNRQLMAEQVITADLTKKGFHRDDTAPDMLIGLTPEMGVTEDTGYVPSGMIMWNTAGPYDGLSLSVGSADVKDAGFVVSFRDASNKRLLWRGIARDQVVIGDPKKLEKKGRSLLGALLDQFPPKKK
jgi:hypothetical protein